MNRVMGVACGLIWIGLSACSSSHDAAPENEVPVAPVRTMRVQQGRLPIEVTAYGSAASSPSSSVTLSVPSDGQVKTVQTTLGAAVRQGQVLMAFRLSATAMSSYQQAQSSLRLAELDAARIERLFAQQLASNDQKAQAQKAVSDARVALMALDHEQMGLTERLVTAPFDGVVTALPVGAGDRVAAGVPLLTLGRLQGMVVTVGLEPSSSRGVKAGQRVHLQALDGTTGVIEGRVLRVAHALNPRTRLIEADLAPVGEVVPGTAFRAAIETGEQPGWLVPAQAVLRDEQGDAVYQSAQGRARRVVVQVLGGDVHTKVVSGTLDANAPVVVEGAYPLSDGVALRDEGASSPSVSTPPSAP